MFKIDAAYFVYGKEILDDMTELSQASGVPSRKAVFNQCLPRFAISKRNEWMVNHSDMVITCIAHNFGGAAKYADYAKRKNKEVINLYDVVF